VRPVREVCEVLGRRRLGAYHALTLVAPRIAEAAEPGQFVELLAGEDRSFLLRRPFSIHRAERAGAALGTVEVVFDVVGPGTRTLAGLRVHDLVDALGPLGRPFTPPPEPARCLLVGGGYGTAALFFLADELRARRCRVDFLVGAQNHHRLFGAMEARRLGHTLTLTTDDGSAGQRGLVTDPLPALLERLRTAHVYACGPMPMLAAVSRVAGQQGVPCQVAVEELMACGTGICFSCVVPVGDPARPGEPARMARSCLEGPVFDGTAIAWGELGHATATPTPATAAAAAPREPAS
jgi:dihydroorotate dehydrogenase electron transfer subunit